MKNIFKNLGLSSLHIFVYFLFQILSAIVLVFVSAFFEMWKHSDEILEVLNTNPELIDVEISRIVLSESVLSSVIVSMLFSSILTIIYFFIFFKVRKEKVIKKISMPESIRYLGFGVLLNLMISFVLFAIEPYIPVSANEELNNLMNAMMDGNFVIVLLTVGILGPIVEEMVFRYGVFKQLSNLNVTFAMFVSSLLFGLAHLNLVQSTYATLLGFLFVFIYYKSDNLLYPILLHIGINSSSVIASELFLSDWVGLGVCVTVSLIAILVASLIEMGNKQKVKEIVEMPVEEENNVEKVEVVSN